VVGSGGKQRTVMMALHRQHVHAKHAAAAHLEVVPESGWSHEGQFCGEFGIKLRAAGGAVAEYRLRVQSGAWENGFSALVLDSHDAAGKLLESVDLLAKLKQAAETAAAANDATPASVRVSLGTVHSTGLQCSGGAAAGVGTVEVTSVSRVSVTLPFVSLVLVNYDHFINLAEAALAAECEWQLQTESSKLPMHGLLGQSAFAAPDGEKASDDDTVLIAEVSGSDGDTPISADGEAAAHRGHEDENAAIEGAVDDYSVYDDLFGHDFLYSRYA
jgi:hypothetical protein